MFELIFFGDIIGNKSVLALCELIQNNSELKNVHFKFANAENASNGFGLTENDYKKLISSGFDALTTGNHVWSQKEIFYYINNSLVTRPYNLPSSVPGKGFMIINKCGLKVGVLNLMGRVFMPSYTIDCPFRMADKAIDEMKAMGVDEVIVDIHAEATSEKMALAHYLDGRVLAVLGTHTHVQTADACILPKGTLYMTDIGPCIPINSIIGMKIESCLPRFLTGLPSKVEVSSNKIKIHGIHVKFDRKSRVTHFSSISV